MAETAFLNKRSEIWALALMAGLFALFGCVTWLNGVLIPFLKLVCALNTVEALLVTFAFYIAYFVMAIPSARVLAVTGYRRGMALGLGVMAVGALLFVPAALARSYEVFLAGLFVQGTGLCLLQTAANPYVIILGPSESAARRVSVMGVCNKLGGVISPMVLGALIFAGLGNITTLMSRTSTAVALADLADRLIQPYSGMAVGLLVIAVAVEKSGLPEPEEPRDSDTGSGFPEQFRLSRYPLLALGVWALFFEMALEVVAGDTIILYGEALHFSIQTARFFASMTLGAMVLGYLLGIAIVPRWLKQEMALAWSAALGILLTIGITITHGMPSVLFVASLGLANAILWPAIFSLAMTDLGKYTKVGAAIMIMAIIGGAVVPPAYGALARVIGNKDAYISLVPMYGVILGYALFARKHIAVNKHQRESLP